MTFTGRCDRCRAVLALMTAFDDALPRRSGPRGPRAQRGARPSYRAPGDPKSAAVSQPSGRLTCSITSVLMMWPSSEIFPRHVTEFVTVSDIIYAFEAKVTFFCV